MRNYYFKLLRYFSFYGMVLSFLLLGSGLTYAQIFIEQNTVIHIGEGTLVSVSEPSASELHQPDTLVGNTTIYISENTLIVGLDNLYLEQQPKVEEFVKKQEVKPVESSTEMIELAAVELETKPVQKVFWNSQPSSSGLGGGAYVQHLLVLPTPSHQKANLSTNEFNLIYFLEFYKEIEQYIVDKTSYGFIPIVNSRPPPLV